MALSTMLIENTIELKFVHCESINVPNSLLTNDSETQDTTTFNDVYVLIKTNTELVGNNLELSRVDGSGYATAGTNKIYGFIQNNTNALYLFGNFGNYNYLTNNVEVVFPTFTGTNTADYINNCTFGKIYTDNYAQNRLMVSGNPTIKNCDWWTKDINIYGNTNSDIKTNDLTYFPATNYCYYGGEDSKVVGYSVDASGKLVVFKEFSNGEPTIYFREGVQNYKSQDTVSGQYFYDYLLNMKSGNAGVSPLNPSSILNFNGRTLFLSNEKCVDVLMSTNISLDNAKYATSSSYYIDAKIKEYSEEYLKENAFLYSYHKWLYLVIGQIIYCARYDEVSETYQYEWYVLGTSILEEDEVWTNLYGVDGKLYMITNKGNIFVNENETNEVYQDNHKTWLEEGDFTDNVLAENIIENLESGDRLVTDYYINITNILTFTKIDNTTYQVSGDSSLLQWFIDTEHAILDSSLQECELTYSLEDGYILKTLGETDTFYIKQDETINLVIRDIDNDGVMDLALEYDENYYEVSLYNPSASYTGYIAHYENVDAIFVSAPFSFGTLSTYKNIIAYTITNDTRKASEMYLAIISNSIPLADAKYLGSNNVIVQKAKDLGIAENDIYAFSLDDFDFTTMSLTQDYVAVRAKTVYRNIVRQRFTDFVFYNKNSTNAVLSTLTIDYKLTTPVVGGE